MAGKALASKTGQVRFSVPGAAGPIGPLIYPAGEYNAATKYIRTALSAPMVLDDGQYYVLNKEGTFTGIRPKDDYAANGSKATWVLMEYVKYAFVEVLMANFAKLASAVFVGDLMMSQHGYDWLGNDTDDYQKYPTSGMLPIDPGTGKPKFDFLPNLLLNFLTGSASFAKGKAKFYDDGSVEIEGKISSSSKGARIVIDPESNSLYMLNQDGKEIFNLSFMTESIGSTTNYYPILRIKRYSGDNVVSQVDVTGTGSINIIDSVGSLTLNTGGLYFYNTSGSLTKSYPGR